MKKSEQTKAKLEKVTEKLEVKKAALVKMFADEPDYAWDWFVGRAAVEHFAGTGISKAEAYRAAAKDVQETMGVDMTQHERFAATQKGE